jgi:hypothetical protein
MSMNVKGIGICRYIPANRTGAGALGRGVMLGDASRDGAFFLTPGKN